MTTNRITTYDEFWLFYVREHSHPLNRQLHFIGSSLGLVCLALLFYNGNLLFFPLGLVIGYGFAWVGHFFVEKNRPASFKYPLKSFISDWRLLYVTLTFQAAAEVEAYRAQGLIPAAKAAPEPAGAAR